MNKFDSSITWLRVCAMLMIVGCHIMIVSPYRFGTAAALLLNVGVEIFFMISGYLYGQREIPGKYTQWYAKRFLRLAPPYYLFFCSTPRHTFLLGNSPRCKKLDCSAILFAGYGNLRFGRRAHLVHDSIAALLFAHSTIGQPEKKVLPEHIRDGIAR